MRASEQSSTKRSRPRAYTSWLHVGICLSWLSALGCSESDEHSDAGQPGPVVASVEAGADASVSPATASEAGAAAGNPDASSAARDASTSQPEAAAPNSATSDAGASDAGNAQ